MMTRIGIAIGALCCGALAAGAQRWTPAGVTRPQGPGIEMAASLGPPSRLIPRLHRYMNAGTVAGAATGILVGYATLPKGDARSADILVHGMVGAAIGNLAGLVVGLAERQPTDTLPAPLSNAVLESPMPFAAARIESASRYVGLGGRIGASVGFLGALVFADDMRALAVPFGALGGWVVGMGAGGVAHAVRGARD